MIPRTIRRRDPEQRMARFYHLAIQYDLLAPAVLLREWGRIGSPGQVRCDLYDSLADAEGAGVKLVEVKRRRGYG